MSDETKSYPLPDEDAPAFAHGDYVNCAAPGLTKRELAACILCVPCGTDWLDKMIEQARRDRIAERVLAGLASDSGNDKFTTSQVAYIAFDLADAMLAHSAKGGE